MMRQVSNASVLSRVAAFVLSLAMVPALTQPVFAASPKPIVVRATGQITSVVFCSATEVCQQTSVSGLATRIGTFTGTLSERLNLLDGTHSGTATLTTANGDTISTVYTGQFTPPDQNGITFFIEHHQILSGTGRFGDVTGSLDVVGTADAATGAVDIIGVGSLTL